MYKALHGRQSHTFVNPTYETLIDHEWSPTTVTLHIKSVERLVKGLLTEHPQARHGTYTYVYVQDKQGHVSLLLNKGTTPPPGFHSATNSIMGGYTDGNGHYWYPSEGEDKVAQVTTDDQGAHSVDGSDPHHADAIAAHTANSKPVRSAQEQAAAQMVTDLGNNPVQVMVTAAATGKAPTATTWASHANQSPAAMFTAVVNGAAKQAAQGNPAATGAQAQAAAQAPTSVLNTVASQGNTPAAKIAKKELARRQTLHNAALGRAQSQSKAAEEAVDRMADEQRKRNN